VGTAVGVILLLTFAVSLVPLVKAATAGFPDVSATHRYYAAITELTTRGIISGKTDGRFWPDDPVTRQQFAKMIVGTAGYPVSERDICPFSDVADGGATTFFPDNFIAVCAAKGITTGVTATTFDPHSNISRYQAVSMVVRAAADLLPGLLTAPPEDWKATAGWGDDPTHGANARLAEYHGLLAGLDLASLHPAGKMTRGEVSQVLANLLLKIAGDDRGDDATGLVGLDSWTRHVVDAHKPWQAVFITAADLDGDRRQDIVAGAWWYKNPGTPGGVWVRNEIGRPLNNMAAVHDFDGDGRPDILGTQGVGSGADARLVWAHNLGAGAFEVLENVEAGRGDFLQGAAVDSVGTGSRLGVALSWHVAGAGIQIVTVPADPLKGVWTWRQISPISQDEALSSGDIDRDGDVDLLLGTIWMENQSGSWVEHTLHDTKGAPYGRRDPDRNRLADINGDGRLDALVGYEAVSVDGKVAWYEQGANARSSWIEHQIATVVGPMSLDVADMDRDGDLDVIVGEHDLAHPSSAKLYVFENVDGAGSLWKQHLVYRGDEHHDGAQVVDIDSDGDLDIISLGWGHANVVVYENKAVH
jgi:hypothetical protein